MCTHVLVQFRDNLTARLQLLGQLHMKLPEDLNAAEQQLRDSDLPELDQQTQLLKKQIQVITAPHHMVSICLHLTCSDHTGTFGPHVPCADENYDGECTCVVTNHTWICITVSSASLA